MLFLRDNNTCSIWIFYHYLLCVLYPGVVCFQQKNAPTEKELIKKSYFYIFTLSLVERNIPRGTPIIPLIIVTAPNTRATLLGSRILKIKIDFIKIHFDKKLLNLREKCIKKCCYLINNYKEKIKIPISLIIQKLIHKKFRTFLKSLKHAPETENKIWSGCTKSN